MKPFKVVGLTLLAIALLVGLWFGGWALVKANTEKRYEVNTSTQQYQSALVSQQRDRATAYDVATDEGQRRRIAAQICAVHNELTRPPADLVQAHAAICF